MNKKTIATAILSILFVTGVYSAEESFKRLDPWTVIVKRADTNNDNNLSPSEIVNFKHSDRYTGFQPFMASHFPKFDANKDGVLTIEECRRGMKQLDYTDGQVTQEFNRDYYGFRALMEAKSDKTRQ
jgi:EF hand